MNLINQSATVWGETPYIKEEAILWIERAGRTCYRSEDKIIEGSGQKFVENIWKRKHFSVIEHSNLVIRTREKSKYPHMALQVEKSVYNSIYFNFAIVKDQVYIGGNWRAWIEWYNCLGEGEMTLDNLIETFDNEMYEVVTEPDEIPNEMKMITVEFITDRAVTHEMVRHRPASYSQESQRYVRYGDIDFIKPAWHEKASPTVKAYFWVCCNGLDLYYKWFMKDAKMKAEDARVILPNCTATKIIMSATVPEWKHVFMLRTSKAAYPQIRNLMQPVFEDFVYNGWIS